MPEDNQNPKTILTSSLLSHLTNPQLLTQPPHQPKAPLSKLNNPQTNLLKRKLGKSLPENETTHPTQAQVWNEKDP